MATELCWSISFITYKASVCNFLCSICAKKKLKDQLLSRARPTVVFTSWLCVVLGTSCPLHTDLPCQLIAFQGSASAVETRGSDSRDCCWEWCIGWFWCCVDTLLFALPMYWRVGLGSRHAYVMFLKSLFPNLSGFGVFFFKLGIKVTIIKLGLEVNAVTLDLALIRQAWKNENCFCQLCQLSIWWCLGRE